METLLIHRFPLQGIRVRYHQNRNEVEIMTYHGRIENGKVVLDEPVELPEGAEVNIALLDEAQNLVELRQGLLRFAGVAQGMPPDMARNHDHYHHGTLEK